MGLKKLAEKMADYNARLESGKVSKIKPGHVQKVLEKLQNKVVELEDDLARAETPDETARLQKKLDVARAQVERGEWLLDQLS